MLVENLATLVTKTSRKPIIIVAALGEQPAQSAMQGIAPFNRELHLVQSNQPRATPTIILHSFLLTPREFQIAHTDLATIISAPNAASADK
jgi:hypothetical protein